MGAGNPANKNSKQQKAVGYDPKVIAHMAKMYMMPATETVNN